jgi:hypothetical protein
VQMRLSSDMRKIAYFGGCVLGGSDWVLDGGLFAETVVVGCT